LQKNPCGADGYFRHPSALKRHTGKWRRDVFSVGPPQASCGSPFEQAVPPQEDINVSPKKRSPETTE
jgi:hypothetical protein